MTQRRTPQNPHQHLIGKNSKNHSTACNKRFDTNPELYTSPLYRASRLNFYRKYFKLTDKAVISLSETKNYINNISNELTQSFKEVINGDWGLEPPTDIKNIFLLDIEVFPDGYGLALYPSDNEVTQLGYKKLLEKYSDGPLRDDNYKHGLDFSSYDFDNEQDLQKIDEYYKSLTNFYFEWISNCWDKAGGASFLKPIYVMMHDGSESFDLQKKEWVTDETKWLH